MEKDFRKQAIIHLYGAILDSVEKCLYDMSDNSNGTKYTSLDQLKERDFEVLVNEYIREDIGNKVKDEIHSTYTPNYLRHLLTYAGRLIEIIDGNWHREEHGREPIIRWDFIYEHIIGELEKLFGGRIKVYVNVYHITRHYGGAEEGGWWYNWYECVQVEEVPYEQADSVAEKLEEEHGKGEGDISSVLGGYEVWVNVEDFPRESQTTQRPYYC